MTINYRSYPSKKPFSEAREYYVSDGIYFYCWKQSSSFWSGVFLSRPRGRCRNLDKYLITGKRWWDKTNHIVIKDKDIDNISIEFINMSLLKLMNDKEDK